MIELSVDGSYKKHEDTSSSGLVIRIDGGEPVCYHVKCMKMLNKHKNITGELVAASLGLGIIVQLVEKLDLRKTTLSFSYDYEGIGMFAKRVWFPAIDLAKTYTYIYLYHALPKLKERGINIEFKKIKSHTGDYLNELADKAASGTLPGARVLHGPTELHKLCVSLGIGGVK